jgi:hypothetical protein
MEAVGGGAGHRVEEAGHRREADGLREAEAARISAASPGRPSAPTKCFAETTTSTSAESRPASPLTPTRRVFSRRSASPSIFPLATSPVASPATVASRMTGKTLSVPVERVQRGMSRR